jgi:pimeloyl-ACP methyl ester carboxylesterase
MHKFNSSGVSIAYDSAGEDVVGRPPVLLIHGFASNARVNWHETGWVRWLVDAGRHVIWLDNRGHGESEKLYDSAQYSAMIMADDAARLLRHLGHSQADVMGYSMGARITAFMLINHPTLVRRAVLAGLAANMIAGVPGSAQIAAALEADSLDQVTDLAGRAFRIFAERTGGDKKALAACIRSSRAQIKTDALAHVSCPVMVVAGDMDELAGNIGPLVDAIPGAVGLKLPGKNHMSAVGDTTFKHNAITFLA